MATMIQPQACDEVQPSATSAAFQPSLRLVWQKYKDWWWPGIYYNDIVEFNNIVSNELDKENDVLTKNALALQLMEASVQFSFATGSENGDQGYVRLLGRPVCDYHQVKEHQYLDYYAYIAKMGQELILKPRAFGRDKHDIYMQFHRGVDEASDIVRATLSEPPLPREMRWSFRGQRAWEEAFDSPSSPMVDSVVAAVSLAEDSTATPYTTITNESSPSHQEEDGSPKVLSPPPLVEGISPIRPYCTWERVWAKMRFSGWQCRVVRPHGKIYISPNKLEMNEKQAKIYAQENYNWTGERRATRNSVAPMQNSTKTKYSFGVLWKRHLVPGGWSITKVKGSGPIEWHYIRPGKTVEDGTQGVDYFISPDDVLQYCHEHEDFPDSSESEPSSPETDAMETDQGNEDDDESTKVPAETEDEHSVAACQTPQDQPTKPQDPAVPLSGSSAESEMGEDIRYSWPNVWDRLKNEGWECKRGRNLLDTWWYLPPPNLNMDRVPVKEWVRNRDYFADPNEIIAHVRSLEGCPANEQASLNLQEIRPASRNSDKEPSNKPTRRSAAKDKPAPSKIDTKPMTVNGQKRQSKKTGPEKARKKSRKTSTSLFTVKDINVKLEGDQERAPWERNPLPIHLHSLLMSAGASYGNGYYYLPNECAKSYTSRYSTAQEWIQHCSTVGCVDLEALSNDHRPVMERLLAYGNVSEKHSTWRDIRAITTEETKSFLGLLGYEELCDGSWKSPAEMTEYLFKQSHPSLSSLVGALRRAPVLSLATSRRRRGSSATACLSKEQMLALRLRVAEGLDGETWTFGGNMDPESKEESEEDKELAPQPMEIQDEPEEEDKEPNDLEFGEVEIPVVDSGEVDVEDLLLAEVAKLRDSQISASEGWSYLHQLGCSYNGGNYSVPAKKERFSSIDDLVHFILLKSVTVLDFYREPLRKAALQRLHRWLKFSFVKLTSTSAVIKSLKNLESPEKLTALIEKIGFTRNGPLYHHKNSTDSYELEQVINTIRLQREDLLQIGLEGKKRSCRSEGRETLSTEEDLTLRLWAASSDYSLQFFYEDTYCAEAQETESEDVPDNDTEGDSDLLLESDQNVCMATGIASDGDKVLEVEEATASFSSNGALRRVPIDQSASRSVLTLVHAEEVGLSSTNSAHAENQKVLEEELGASGSGSMKPLLRKTTGDDQRDGSAILQGSSGNAASVAACDVSYDDMQTPLQNGNEATKSTEQNAHQCSGTPSEIIAPLPGALQETAEARGGMSEDGASVSREATPKQGGDEETKSTEQYAHHCVGTPSQVVTPKTGGLQETAEDCGRMSEDGASIGSEAGYEKSSGQIDASSLHEPFSSTSVANDVGRNTADDSSTTVEGLPLMTQPNEGDSCDNTTDGDHSTGPIQDASSPSQHSMETDGDHRGFGTPVQLDSPTNGTEAGHSPDITNFLFSIEKDSSMQWDESSQQNGEMAQTLMTQE